MSISPCPVCSVIPALIETHFNHKYLLKGLRIFDINVEFKINCHHFTLQWLGRWESEFGMDIEKPENSWYNYTSAEQIKTWSPGLALTVTVTRFPDTIIPTQSSQPMTNNITTSSTTERTICLCDNMNKILIWRYKCQDQHNLSTFQVQ